MVFNKRLKRQDGFVTDVQWDITVDSLLVCIFRSIRFLVRSVSYFFI